MRLRQAETIVRRGAQPINKVHSDSVIVVKAELQTGQIGVARVVEDLFHHLAVLAGRFSVETGLRQIGGDVAQTVHMMPGHHITDHDDQFEIGVGLRFQAGQGDGFEQLKPLFKPPLVVKIGDAVLDRVVPDLKSAKGRIGKPAKTNDLHRIGALDQPRERFKYGGVRRVIASSNSTFTRNAAHRHRWC